MSYKVISSGPANDSLGNYLQFNNSTVNLCFTTDETAQMPLCMSVQGHRSRELSASRNAAAGLKEPEARLYECFK